jgi:non-ribosomal peptide synthetase component F
VQGIRALAGTHQSDHVAFGPYVNVIPNRPVVRFGAAEGTLRNQSTGFVDDLMFTFMDASDGGLDIHVNGNPALHSAAQVEAHATRLVAFLRRALSDFSVPVADIPLLVEGDPAVAAEAGPAGRLDVPGVVEAVHRVAAEDPTRIAIRDDEGDVSYLELALAADAIAQRLRPGTVAAVLAAPGRHFVTALVAVQQAGAAWTPIDVDSPRERKLTLIADSGASVVLATGEYSS